MPAYSGELQVFRAKHVLPTHACPVAHVHCRVPEQSVTEVLHEFAAHVAAAQHVPADPVAAEHVCPDVHVLHVIVPPHPLGRLTPHLPAYTGELHVSGEQHVPGVTLGIGVGHVCDPGHPRQSIVPPQPSGRLTPHWPG